MVGNLQLHPSKNRMLLLIVVSDRQPDTLPDSDVIGILDADWLEGCGKLERPFLFSICFYFQGNNRMTCSTLALQCGQVRCVRTH